MASKSDPLSDFQRGNPPVCRELASPNRLKTWSNGHLMDTYGTSPPLCLSEGESPDVEAPGGPLAVDPAGSGWRRSEAGVYSPRRAADSEGYWGGLTRMSPRDLGVLMACDWKPVFEAQEDGTFRLTVAPLTDFELYGSKEELDAEWREALESHLAGYLAVGKAVPVPTYRIAGGGPATSGDGQTSRWVLNERLEPVA